MPYINKLNTIIHRLDNADFDNVVYNQFYVSSPISVVVNGFSLGTVSITEEPINIIIRDITSVDQTLVYVIGTRLQWYGGELKRGLIGEFITTESGVDLLTESGVELEVE